MHQSPPIIAYPGHPFSMNIKLQVSRPSIVSYRCVGFSILKEAL